MGDQFASKPLLWGKHCRGPGCDDFNEAQPSCGCTCSACKPPVRASGEARPTFDPDDPERPVPGISDRDEVSRLSQVVIMRNTEIAHLKLDLAEADEYLTAREKRRSEAARPPYHPELHEAFVDLVDAFVRASGGRTTPDQMGAVVRSGHFHAIEEAAERMVKGTTPPRTADAQPGLLEASWLSMLQSAVQSADWRQVHTVVREMHRRWEPRRERAKTCAVSWCTRASGHAPPCRNGLTGEEREMAAPLDPMLDVDHRCAPPPAETAMGDHFTCPECLVTSSILDGKWVPEDPYTGKIPKGERDGEAAQDGVPVVRRDGDRGEDDAKAVPGAPQLQEVSRGGASREEGRGRSGQGAPHGLPAATPGEAHRVSHNAGKAQPKPPCAHESGANGPWPFYVWADGDDARRCSTCFPRTTVGGGATAPKGHVPTATSPAGSPEAGTTWDDVAELKAYAERQRADDTVSQLVHLDDGTPVYLRIGEERADPSSSPTPGDCDRVMTTLLEAGLEEPHSNIDFAIPKAVAALLADVRRETIEWCVAWVDHEEGHGCADALAVDAATQLTRAAAGDAPKERP